MILINTMEDIEALSVIMDNFSIKRRVEKTATKPVDNSLNERLENLEKKMDVLYNHFVVEKTEADDSESMPTTIRKYSKTQEKNLPKVYSLREDGHFNIGKNKISKYSIEDLLLLKRLIPRKECGFKEMGMKIGVSDFTVKMLCYGVETGYFDKYFNEWEQLKANQFFKKKSNWKGIVENNPQKRKEKGMV